MNKEDLRKKYLDAAEKFNHQVEAEDRTLLFLSILRFICFAGGQVLIIFMFIQNVSYGFIAAFVIIVLFLFLLKLFSDHTARKEFISNLAKVNRNEGEAVSGNLAPFESGESYIDHSHDFSFDIDLFGESSLFRYLNRTVTGYGRDILAGWLSDPYILSGELGNRQEIIRELSGKESWRQSFMAYGMKVPLEKEHISGLMTWMEGKSEKNSSWLKKVLIYLLPAAALLSLSLLIAGMLHYSVFTFIFLVNLAYISYGLKDTNKIHRDLSGKYSYLSSMNSLLKVFDNETFNSLYLNEMKLEISGTRVSAAVSVKKLGRLIESFDSRLNFIAGFLLNGLFLWDFHCIVRLEKWKSKYMERFPAWLKILGNVDAYTSLGNYAFNNPDFVYPVFSDSNIIFFARDLGHPLINDEMRVNNDFSLDNAGNICIISGANMAGKSTFLRTVAVNFILGMTGCPVCAAELVFTPMKIFTSMRTTDSLSSHESYFYAELKRLKTLKTKIAGDEPVFFILDEILKGTNSTDKSVGSKLFIEKLITHRGTGLIATHDISLGELEKDYPDRIFNMCFEIEIDGEAIKFDYKLNRGVTQKMNAALLMRQMGILD